MQNATLSRIGINVINILRTKTSLGRRRNEKKKTSHSTLIDYNGE